MRFLAMHDTVCRDQEYEYLLFGPKKMEHKILIVDDDLILLEAMELILKHDGYHVITAKTQDEAISMVQKFGRRFSLVILDYHLGEVKGTSLIQSIRKIDPYIFLLIYSGDSSRNTLKNSWEAGATGFLEKGQSETDFLSTVKNWCMKYDQTQRILDPFITSGSDFLPKLQMVGRSKAMKDIEAKVKRYQSSFQNVLISGETGTGKELIAKALHSGIATQFFAVNCASYSGSSELLDSELFGHEKGAFTGAVHDKKGIFEHCQGGSIFLDEIHHLSLTAQAKLLRVCQEKKIRRVGGSREVPVEFRLIAASKSDIEERINRGDFLRDLFHRLNVLSIEIPSLSERPEDIEPLVAYFCEKFSNQHHVKKFFQLRTIRQMQHYSWPGNVRELENTVYRLLTDSSRNEISPDELDPKFFSKSEKTPTHYTYEALKGKHEDEEREYLKEIIKKSKNKMEAATKLQIAPSTLHSIMKRVGLYSNENEGKG